MPTQELKTARQVRSALKSQASSPQAKTLSRFFKTGPGEYGEGDLFWGLKVPQTRQVARRSGSLSRSQLQILLKSKMHEERLLALMVLGQQFRRAAPREQKAIFNFYMKNRKQVNNWDLVDSSTVEISGPYLWEYSTRRAPEHSTHPKSPDSSVVKLLMKLADSSSLWDRRIAIMSTFTFIRKGHFQTTFKIAKSLLQDEEDLIHKAVGWMIREVGNRDLQIAEDFVFQHGPRMPRTMLRYAIERFPEKKRKYYLKHS